MPTRPAVRASSICLLVLLLPALAVGCGGSGGGSGNPGLEPAPLPTFAQIYPDVAQAVFAGGVVADATVGDAPSQLPIDHDVRAIFRFDLTPQVPAGSTILSVELTCPVTDAVGQPTGILPVQFESRAIGKNSSYNTTDVLSGDWGPGTSVGAPTSEGPGQPDRWEIEQTSGQGIANTIEAIVGPLSSGGMLLDDLLVRVRGTPNLSGSSDQLKIGGVFPPTNQKYVVSLLITYFPPEF